MRPYARAAFCVVVAGSLCIPPASAASARSEAIKDAASFLASRQQPDGSFFRAGAPADGVSEVVAALATVGAEREVRARAMRYLEKSAVARARERGGYAGRITQGIVAAGHDPRAFAGADVVAILESFYDPVTGRYDNGIYANALAVLGVLAAKQQLPERAVDFIELNQCGDGGFGHEEGCLGGADVDTTSLVVAALRAAGIRSDEASVARARAWLLSARNADGGFGARPGDRTNANSTGLAICAVVALGEDPESEPWTGGGAGPLAALLALRHSGGGFRYIATQDAPNDYATVQALPALAKIAYPLKHRDVAEDATGTLEPARGIHVGDAAKRRSAGVSPPSAAARVRSIREESRRLAASEDPHDVATSKRERPGRGATPLAAAVLLALSGAPVLAHAVRGRRSP